MRSPAGRSRWGHDVMDPRVTLGGLSLWGTDGDGVRWIVPKNGLNWSGSGASTRESIQRARAHGGWSGGAYLRPRSYSLRVELSGPDRASVERALDALTAAATIGQTVLSVREDGGERSTLVGREDEVLVTWHNHAAAAWSTGLVAADPRRYAAEVQRRTGLPSASGGLVLRTVGALTVPLVIHSRISTGQVSIVNAGSVEAPVVVRFEGPVQGPAVRHVQSGLTLRLSPRLYLGPGEWVDVDMDARQVLAQGTAARNQFVVSRGWSAACPGDNTWAFSAASSGDEALMTVSTRPAWV